MTTNNSCYLDLARHLADAAVEGSLVQAKFRTIISRSYYSCYYEALELLKRMQVEVPSDKVLPGAGMHKRVIHGLQDAHSQIRHLNKPILRKAYMDFRVLRDRRVAADYDWNKVFNEEYMRGTLKMAEGTFATLKRL